MVTLPKKALLTLVASCTLLAPALHAKSDNMVKSIMKLRADVESLYTQIDENKDTYKSKMKSLTMQITDNEAQINRQTTSLKLTEQEFNQTQEKIDKLSSGTQDIKPMLHDAIAKLENVIKGGIPFKTTDRLAELSKLKNDLDSGNITQEKALSLVWASYDDTIRLTKEVGLFKQQITIGEDEKLAKIAKIGSVMMFFATPDDKVGYVKKSADKYEYVVTSDEEDRKKIIALFDALQKQIRTGYFSVPNALILAGDK